jgi:hypothetical protein
VGRGDEGVDRGVVRKPRKPVPEKVAMIWAREWTKEGKNVTWQKLMPPKGFRVLPRRWVVKRTFAWIGHNRRMSKDYERLCAAGEAFVYAAMTRLMVRRLTCAQGFPDSLWKVNSRKFACRILRGSGPMIRRTALCPGRLPCPKPHI